MRLRMSQGWHTGAYWIITGRSTIYNRICTIGSNNCVERLFNYSRGTAGNRNYASMEHNSQPSSVFFHGPQFFRLGLLARIELGVRGFLMGNQYNFQVFRQNYRFHCRKDIVSYFSRPNSSTFILFSG